MELRERLLHNEIQNLGQMVQIMSYEMALMGDFLKEQFGSSYALYRSRHSHQAKVPSSSRKTNLTARKSTSSSLKRENPESSSVAKKLKTTDNQGDDNNEGVDDYPDVDEVGNDSSVYSIDDQDNVSVGSNSFPEGAEIISFVTPKNESERSLGGRNRMEIWNRYIVAKLPNGKLSAKCRNCFNYVSCKTERLTMHYTKCVVEGMSFGKKSGGPFASKNKSSSFKSEEADKKMVTEYLATKGGVQRENAQEAEKGAYRGRVRDPIWDFYNTVEDPFGKKIARCKKCDEQVSPKVERLRRHFIVCHKLEDDDNGVDDGRGGGGGSDDGGDE